MEPSKGMVRLAAGPRLRSPPISMLGGVPRQLEQIVPMIVPLLVSEPKTKSVPERIVVVAPASLVYEPKTALVPKMLARARL